MPKFAKRSLIVLAALLLAVAVVLLCINLYLQSKGVQQRIHGAVVKATGVDFTIGSTAYTPWGGLVLKAITVADPLTPTQNIVDAKALRIHFALLPLFDKRFVVTECILSEPTLLARQLESGDWLIPVPAKEPPVAPEADAPKIEAPASRGGGPVFRAQLEKFRIRDGTVTFIDRRGRTVLQLEKMNVTANVAADLTATGTFEVGRANISNYVKPNDIGGPFSWDGHVFDLPKIEGSLAGGKITGNYRTVVIGADPNYALNVNLDGVLLKKLVRDAGMEPGKTDGRLKGNLQLTGDPRSSKETAGQGHFELESAKLKPVDFLIKLGELFQIEELQLLELKEAWTNITIRNERITIDDLLMKSENLMLRGKGPIRFSGKMDIDAELLINRKLQDQLKSIGLLKSFVESEIPEYRKLPFEVTGKVDSPKTDLLDKLIGINTKDVGGLLKGLFRPAKPATPGN